MRRLILPLVLVMFAQQAGAEAFLEGRLSFLLTVRQELAAGRMTLPELDRSSLTDPNELGNLAPWIAAEQKFPGSVRFHAAPAAGVRRRARTRFPDTSGLQKRRR